MPTDSVFLDREREAKASVILRLRSRQLSEDTQKSIASLVSGAVDKLNPQNVLLPMQIPTNQSSRIVQDRPPMPNWKTSFRSGW